MRRCAAVRTYPVRAFVPICLGVVAGITPDGSAAQDEPPTSFERGRFEVGVEVTGYGTGDRINCSVGAGVGGGLHLISTRLLAGRTIAHVLADGSPGGELEAVEPDLEDVYFSVMAGHAEGLRRLDEELD